jgi:LuxR family maltose regulon positive regulatory protein
LRERIAVRDAAVTLVSAAAGFGKTTLVAELVADRPRAAWLSLDAADSEPTRFWTYVIEAIRTAVPDVGDQADALVRSPQPPIDAVVTTLLNELHDLADDLTLVLDDYHVIGGAAVHETLTFLVEHLPPTLCLVIASRADPPLPLAALRARGDLVEVRAADLRFTRDEAAAYLSDTMGLTLADSDVAALEERTEGWIAALQLAALSLQGRDDASTFVADFAGDDRFILDYLADEVLERQDEGVRTFLLQTSVLSRLTGPLCDAVTGQEGGRAMLERLDRSNLFLVPLDDRRSWYRYHHLFADVLQARLLSDQAGVVPELHRRAAAWHATEGDRLDAIGHAMAGRAFDQAAELIELEAPALSRARREATLRGWFEALPPALFEDRPVLALAYVGALMATGEAAGVTDLLDRIDRRLRPDTPGEPLYVDHEAFANLPAQVAIQRAGLALLDGDPAATIVHANDALERVAPDDHLRRGAAATLVGLAHWAVGDLQAAEDRYKEGVDELERAGRIADVLGCSLALADLQLAHARLTAAAETFLAALALAGEHGVVRGTADMHVGLAEVALERNDLDTAEAHLATSTELGEAAGLPQHPYRWQVAQARLFSARGDHPAALDLLPTAERLYNSDFSPPIQPVPAVMARVRVITRDQPRAQEWVRERGIGPEDQLTYLAEYEHLTLARVLIAAGELEQADSLVARLGQAAEAGGRTRSILDTLILAARIRGGEGDTDGAVALLDQALLLAEPEGYVRPFLDEGPALVDLLRAVATRGTAREQASRVLGWAVPAVDRPSSRSALVEPLSDREIDVLRLLRSDLSGPDIARELIVSLNTVRTHTKNIYAKLGVNNRREAVTRARELGL